MKSYSKITKLILIVLLAAGIVSLLGGSYLTLIYTSKKPTPASENLETSTPQNTNTSTNTTTNTTSPQVDIIAYAQFQSPDNKFSFEYPFKWQKTEPEAKIGPYQLQEISRIQDEKKLVTASIKKFSGDENLTSDDILKAIIQEKESQGYQVEQKSYNDGYNKTGDLTYQKDKEIWRSQIKILLLKTEKNRFGYVIEISSLESYWLNYLTDATHIIGSAALKP